MERYLPRLTEYNTGCKALSVIHLSLQAMNSRQYSLSNILRIEYWLETIKLKRYRPIYTFTKPSFIAWTPFKVHKFLC